ncbi:unnamed protein product [Orchesella dallaii]|uniref:DRBM domain-containing protein n=1 Tax=Orchesella dallaii TaxID=48710 RepID=A0ABP1RSF2_9HEXA
MSLEDYIRAKGAKKGLLSGSTNENLDKGLDELISQDNLGRANKRGLGRGASRRYEHTSEILTSGLVTTESHREYGDDVFKSLDEVVEERGILRPPKQQSYSEQEDFPITGRRAGIMIDQDSLPQRPKKSVKIVMNPEMDPLISALDDMIEARGIGMDELDTSIKKAGEGGRRKRNFEDLISGAGDGFTVSYELGDAFGQGPAKRQQKWPRGLTPYRAVGYLSEKGMLIELKIGKLTDEEVIKEKRDHLWRCIISCGEVEGRADSVRKVVAREMACKEFLKKLREEYPEADIPRCELPPEFLIDPKVMKLVEDMASELGHSWEFKKSVKAIDRDQRQSGDPDYVYVSTYEIGDITIQGVSRDEKYSALEASRKVWELFSGEKFPFTKYFFGDRCDPMLNYDFAESEVYHVLDVDLGKESGVAVSSKQEIEKIMENDESDLEDDDTFPVESFTSVLKRSPDLNEELKRTKQAQEFRKKQKEEENARRNMPVDLEALNPVIAKGNSVFLAVLEPRKSFPGSEQMNEMGLELEDDVVRPTARGSGLPVLPAEKQGVGRGRGMGRGHGRVPITY